MSKELANLKRINGRWKAKMLNLKGKTDSADKILKLVIQSVV